MINDYVNQFLELKIKVNVLNAISIEHVILKFIQELKSQIIFLVYTRNSATLNNMIIVVK